MFGPKCPDHFEQAAKFGTNEMSGLARANLLSTSRASSAWPRWCPAAQARIATKKTADAALADRLKVRLAVALSHLADFIEPCTRRNA